MNDSVKRMVPYPYIGPVLFVIALLIYGVMLSPGAYPGESAWLIAQFSGLEAFSPLGNIMWGALVRVFSWMPGPGLAVMINLLSALAGAAAVWIIYLLVSAIPHNRTAEEEQTMSRPATLQTISGVTAALLLAFSTPMWVLSTRAHYMTFNVLFMLVLMLVFMRFWNNHRLRTLYGFSFLYGLGVVEYPVLILFSPLVLLGALTVLWRMKRLSPATLAKPALCFLAGAWLLPLAAFLFWRHPSFEWFDMTYFHEALLAVAQYQYHVLMGSVARMGWLIIVLFAVLPWFIVFIPKYVSSERCAQLGSYILHALLGVMALLIFYRFKYSPMLQFGEREAILAPYVLIAMWGGYVAGYWCALLCRRVCAPERQTPQYAGLSGREWMFCAVLLAVLAVGAMRNASVADTRGAVHVNRIAGLVLDEIGDRTWLISGGVLDPHIKILAHDRGKTIRILNTSAAHSSSYMKYVASLFEEPRYQSLADVGMTALLSGWFSSDPRIEEYVAVLEAPDIWVGADRLPLPRKVLYVGIDEADIPDMDELYAEHESFWREIAVLNWLPTGGARSASEWARRHIGKVANDLGVLLADEHHQEQAYDSYQWARRIDPDNISALLNQLAAVYEDEEKRKPLEQELERLVGRAHMRPNVWMLSALYGYVRNPAVHFARGRAWVASGRSEAGIREMRRAAALGQDTLDQGLMMAVTLQDMGETEYSDAAFLQILERDPTNQEALFRLYHSHMRSGDTEAARRHLDRLAEHLGPIPFIRTEQATLYATEGDLQTAAQLYRDIVADDPTNVRAWAGRALVAISMDNHEVAEQALTTMRQYAGNNPDHLFSMAQIRSRMGHHETARQTLLRVLRTNPAHRPALEMMLVYDWQMAQREAAKERIDLLLSYDPNHALANFMLGTIQLSLGSLALAESSFRASAERTPSPDAYANLSWLLQQRGAYDEAYTYARKAVEIQPSNSATWHTLGLVELRRNRLDEAEHALQRALELDPDNYMARIYTAYLYEARGLYRESREILEAILLEDVFLLPEMLDELRNVLGRARQLAGN